MTIADGAGPTSRIFFSQKLRLHYVDWGNPAAPLLVLVHGGRDHCRSLDALARRLRHSWHVIAPDLRGHGDSQWSSDGSYLMSGYIYDLAQLIHQQAAGPVAIIAHSLGGMISLRYAGIYPELVRRMVIIEGLGMSPRWQAERLKTPLAGRMRNWIVEQRAFAGRQPRRYATIEDALERMQGENPRLSPEQAHHLTVNGMNRNEDGTYSWKFDNYVRAWPPYDMPQSEVEHLWAAVACPTLMLYGRESTASNPLEDGRAAHFKTARFEFIDGAGHWVHHDQLDLVATRIEAFLDLDTASAESRP
jgi:pimeloyl-ACP methyl ester carboxylesterase